MLYHNPPYLVAGGLALYGDHEDPRQWYHLPVHPRVSVRTGADGRPQPVFSLTRFRSAAAGQGGALLNFDVDLRADEEALRKAADLIRDQARLTEPPRLAPAPLEDGAVRLLLLDHDGAAPEAGRFVLRTSHPAKPALFGDNRATFSALLTEEGAQLVDRLLGGAAVPVGVVYSLDYLALRPAYAVRLAIDWDRLQERLDEEFTADHVFLSTQIAEAVDRLVESRVIDLSVDTMVPEGADAEHVITRRDQAVAEVRDMITESFFTPVINPRPESTSDLDEFAGFLESLHHDAVRGGGLLPAFVSRRTHHTQIDDKRLNVRMNERTTVRRSIYPQAHLTGIEELIRASGLPRDRFVTGVDLPGPWFERRRVRVVSRVDFRPGFITSVVADLRYDDDTKTALFTAGSDNEVVFDWPSVVQGDRVLQPVEGRLTVNLAPVPDLRCPNPLVAPVVSIAGEAWELFPDRLFSLVTVPIRTEGVPWDRWSAVQVSLRYRDPAHGVAQESTVELTEGMPAWNYVLFRMADAPSAFDYRVRYLGRDRPDHERGWTTTDEGEVRVRDPFPAKRSVMVVPVVPWAETDRLLVDLWYADPAHGVRIDQALEFTPEHRETQRFSVDLHDPHRRRIDWRAALLRTDGTVAEIGPSSTTDTRLLIRPGMTPHHVVLVTADLSEAARRKVRDTVVSFALPGSDAVLAELTFRPDSPPQEFHFDAADAAYRYRVAHNHTNGLSRTGEWTESRAEDLAVGID